MNLSNILFAKKYCVNCENIHNTLHNKISQQISKVSKSQQMSKVSISQQKSKVSISQKISKVSKSECSNKYHKCQNQKISQTPVD